MLQRLIDRTRRDQSGFTLIELLVVIIIIGILLAIAVPSYLGFKDKAEKSAAQANVRSAIPSAEAYYSDKGETYTGISVTELQKIDKGLSIEAATSASSSTYCISAVKGDYRAKVSGPGGTISVDKSSALAACS